MTHVELNNTSLEPIVREIPYSRIKSLKLDDAQQQKA